MSQPPPARDKSVLVFFWVLLVLGLMLPTFHPVLWFVALPVLAGALGVWVESAPGKTGGTAPTVQRRERGGVLLGETRDATSSGDDGSYERRRHYEDQVQRNNNLRHNQLVAESRRIDREINGRRFDQDKVQMKPLRDSEYGRRNDRDTVRKHFETEAGRRAFDRAYPKNKPFRP